MNHVCEFGYMWRSQTHLEDQARLAGVQDFTVFKRAIMAVVPRPFQWTRLVHILKERAKLRYERGELIREEWRAHRRWCGDTPKEPKL